MAKNKLSKGQNRTSPIEVKVRIGNFAVNYNHHTDGPGQYREYRKKMRWENEKEREKSIHL